MKLRLLLPAFLAIVSLNLFAQPEIVSVTYDGNVAILTTNVPPDGIIYYWQGTSCGTLMNHSSSTTLVSSDGTYYLRAFDSTGDVWATSCASTVVMFPDNTPPILSNVTPGPISAGTVINATSNEDGMIYLVPSGTAGNVGAITAAQVAQATAVAGVASSLSTGGLPEADYVVYAVDGSDNVSAASPVITISWTTSIDPNSASQKQVQIYPVNVKDVLYIKSGIRVSSVKVFSLQGAQVLDINTPVDQVDMSSLGAGVYIVNIQLEDKQVFNGKITKQ